MVAITVTCVEEETVTTLVVCGITDKQSADIMGRDDIRLSIASFPVRQSGSQLLANGCRGREIASHNLPLALCLGLRTAASDEAASRKAAEMIELNFILRVSLVQGHPMKSRGKERKGTDSSLHKGQQLQVLIKFQARKRKKFDFWTFKIRFWTTLGDPIDRSVAIPSIMPPGRRTSTLYTSKVLSEKYQDMIQI